MAFVKREVVLVAAAVIFAAILAVSADSGEKDAKKLPTTKPYPAVRRTAARPAGYGDSDSDEKDARYQFAYKVRASGGRKSGYGSGKSGEAAGSSDSAEFGHSETRNGDNTDGQYYVDLPDGRRQTVAYYVNGDSGFIAKVSYSGDAKPVKTYSTGYNTRRVYANRPIVSKDEGSSSSSEEKNAKLVRYVIGRRPAPQQPTIKREEIVDEVVEVANEAAGDSETNTAQETPIVVLANDADQAGATADVGAEVPVEAADVADLGIQALADAIDLRTDAIPEAVESAPAADVVSEVAEATNGALEGATAGAGAVEAPEVTVTATA